MTRSARMIRLLAGPLRPVLIRNPRLALALARAEADNRRDGALIPLLDAGLGIVDHPSLRARRAQALDLAGDYSTALDDWRSVPHEDARRRARVVEGRLIETDLTWLPRVPGAMERIQPASRRSILHLVKNSVPDRWSGYTIRTHNCLRAQLLAGLEPVAVTDIGWPRAAGISSFEPVATIDGVDYHRLDRGPGYAATAIPNDQRLIDLVTDLLPLARDLRPAIVTAHSGYRGGELALAALALRERTGIPVVYEVRGLFESAWAPDEATATRSERYARWLAQETRILNEVDGVLVISEALMDELAARGVRRERMTLLPNGIDPAAFVAPDRDAPLRRHLGLEGRFVIGYVGNLDHWREGMDLLIQAVALLRDRGRDDIGALIVGDGRERPALVDLARRLGVDDRCHLPGRVPHDVVAQSYAQIDLFACPRREERAARFITPLKPYEAMALGIPVVVSDLPALTEIVSPPERGLAVPVGDAAALADTIEAARADPAMLARVATAGREWVHRERTWASNGPRYRAAYESILGPLD